MLTNGIETRRVRRCPSPLKAMGSMLQTGSPKPYTTVLLSTQA